jgi:hypothetical protein
VKKTLNATLVLTEQEDGATIPVYGRNALVNGEIHLEGRENITSVTVKVSFREHARVEFPVKRITFSWMVCSASR